MERITKIIIIGLCVTLVACTKTVVVKPEPYSIPVSIDLMSPCKNIILLKSGASFEDALLNKIDNDVNTKECISKNKALIQVLESLEDEQIIRFTTPQSP